MELSIKQLRRIETELLNEKDHVIQRLRNFNYETADTKSDAIEIGEERLSLSIESVNALINAQYCVRKLISDFNESAGINDKTLQIANLEAICEARAEMSSSLGKVLAKTEYNSKQTTYSYGVSDEFEDNQRAIERFDKRRIQRLKDSCNGLNSSSKVKIPDTLLTLITKYGLIDTE